MKIVFEKKNMNKVLGYCLAFSFVGFILYHVLLRGGETNFLETTGLKYELDLSQNLEENELPVYSYRYYDRIGDDEYAVNPEFKLSKVYLSPEHTALIIMDPWKNNPSEKINEDVEEIVSDYLLTLTEHALQKEMRIIILSNEIGKSKYNSFIDDRLQALVDEGKAELLTHNMIDSSDYFCEYLQEKGIENIIYTGFATQMCLLFRNAGILSVHYAKKGSMFNLYCIPETTMACVSENKKDNVAMRNNVMIMLAQNDIAELILYKDFISY